MRRGGDTIVGVGRTFQVQLYDKNGKPQWIKVDQPTAAQRMLYAGATDGSLWVSLFELAYLKVRIAESTNPTSSTAVTLNRPRAA